MVRYKSEHDVTDNTQKVADTDMIGTNQEKEINKRLDRLNTIDKILAELEKKK